MVSSVFRISHLILAAISSIFLLIASVTGVILAIDIVAEKAIYPYKVQDFKDITLAQSLSGLRKVYPEITGISIDKNQFVTLEGLDQDGNDVKAIIDPNNGDILGKPFQKSEFINQVTTLHRSLFFHDVGRFVVGIVSSLFFLITVSGIILIIKRQKNIRHFFSKINKDYLPQYFHVFFGRLLLIPILLISLTGTYLFMKRFKLIPEEKEVKITHWIQSSEEKKNITDFPIFTNTLLSNIEKIEFPFDPDDPEDVFVLKLKDRELEINQFSGEITKEVRYPYSVLLANLSLDLHTGRTNIWLALILGITSFIIIVFIYTGFTMTFRRTSAKIRNKYKVNEAEYILLVGSESGTTLTFANKIQKQLIASGKKVFIAYLNEYQVFPKAKYLVVFTSTYGLGDAPANAEKFETLLNKYPQKNTIGFSVVGFGSNAYKDFCGFAKRVDMLLDSQSQLVRFTEIFMINDRSADGFSKWAKSWGEKAGIPLMTSPAYYSLKIAGLKNIKVISKTKIDEQNTTFTIGLKPFGEKFNSGDILAVYPAGDNSERLYSIGKKGKNIQLFVKLHPQGLGSQYLYNLTIDTTIKARIIRNQEFHFPYNASEVAMIANGTGIAPFLGMMREKHPGTKKYLYCGFRYSSEITRNLEKAASENIREKKLDSFKISFSKEENKKYVMDLMREDEIRILNLLKSDGVIMICGALAMQRDVELLLSEICDKNNLHPLDYYKENKRILADCY